MVERKNRFSSRSSSSNTRMGVGFESLRSVEADFSSLMRGSVFARRILGAGVRPHRLGDFWQAIENCNRPQPLSVLDGGIAAHDFSRLHVVGHSALRRYYSAVSDFAVSGDPYLAGENHVFPHFGGAGQPDLSAEHGIGPDTRSMADLN